MRVFYVYIAFNRYRTVFYTGMTNDVRRRMRRHRRGEGGAFTSCYRVRDLVYFEKHDRAHKAIAREKEIKRWRRSRKLALVHTLNPDLDDLCPRVGV